MKKFSIWITFMISLFIIGYLIAANHIVVPLNEEQIELCKDIAEDVYNNIDTPIYEAPSNVNITKGTTFIEVSISGHPGTVRATLNNGDLILTYHKPPTILTILFRTFVALAFTIVVYLIGLGIKRIAVLITTPTKSCISNRHN